MANLELQSLSVISIRREGEDRDLVMNVPEIDDEALQHQERWTEYFLWDDDEVSLGYGKTTLIWQPDALPAIEEVDWDSFESIPLALVDWPSIVAWPPSVMTVV